MKLSYKLIASACILSLAGCATNYSHIPVEATGAGIKDWKSQVYNTCKLDRKSKVKFQDSNTYYLSISTKTKDTPNVGLGVVNALLFVGTLGIVPFCLSRDVEVSTTVGAYKFNQSGCLGWLVWSQEPRYGDVCEAVADNLSDDILYDLYDSGKFKMKDEY